MTFSDCTTSIATSGLDSLLVIIYPRLRIRNSDLDLFPFFFAISWRALRLCVEKSSFTQRRQARKGRKIRIKTPIA